MTPVRYRLSMPEPHTHLFEVEVRLPSPGGALELMMPSWTPGSYLLREFPRLVQDFRAETDAGDPLPWRKRDKNHWRVDAPPSGGVRVRYRVYANELTVRTSHLDASHAYVNGASVLMAVAGREGEPLELSVDAPDGWRAATSLEETGPLRFRAAGYDELVDSPLEIGTHRVLEWEQDGVPHRYAVWGRGQVDGDRLVRDTRRIIDAAKGWFDGLPYSRYTFILHLVPEGRGGLEHAASCSLQAARGALAGDGYEDFLALVAHEFFHVWNAKRIRPAPLGPFDYTRENYTRNLWVVEGWTTYYTDRILLRAGLLTPERYLQRLGEAVGRLQGLPGRHHQSLAEASFDAWIKFYRPDEHTPNSQVSYYQKGALVALLLDLEIRRATRGARSLDDVLRLLWERYGRRDAGFPEDPAEGVRALAEEVAGQDLGPFFRAYVDGVEELDYDRYLAAAGLRLRAVPTEPARGAGTGGTQAAPSRPTDAVVQETRLGIRTAEQGGRLRVTHVLAGTPAHRGGVSAGDELVAVDGTRATAAALAARLRSAADEEPVVLAVLRRDELLSLETEVGPHPAARHEIVGVEEPTPLQQEIRAGWLGAGRGVPGAA